MAKESGKKVLVVDDNDDIREMLGVLLRMEGYRVLAAEDGEEAVQMASREEPDVILMDVMMPKMDGLEAARQIRRNARLADIPIVGLSAFNDPLAESGQLQTFAWRAYLRKPIDVDELERLLRRIFSEREKDSSRKSL